MSGLLSIARESKWAIGFGVGTHILFHFIDTGDLSKFQGVHRMYRYAVFGRLRNLKSGAAPHPFRVGAPILSSPRRPGTWVLALLLF